MRAEKGEEGEGIVFAIADNAERKKLGIRLRRSPELIKSRVAESCPGFEEELKRVELGKVRTQLDEVF